MDIFLNKRYDTFYLLFLKAFIFNLCKFSFEAELIQSHRPCFNTRSTAPYHLPALTSLVLIGISVASSQLHAKTALADQSQM